MVPNMKWNGVLFIVIVTIIGTATPRRLPDVNEGDSVRAVDKTRGPSSSQSSGKHECTDCTPEADSHVTSQDRPSNPGSHHTRLLSDEPTKQSHKQNTAKDSSTKALTERKNTTPFIKPFLSLGGIKIHVNNKQVQLVSSRRHSRRNKHRRKSNIEIKDSLENRREEKASTGTREKSLKKDIKTQDTKHDRKHHRTHSHNSKTTDEYITPVQKHDVKPHQIKQTDKTVKVNVKDNGHKHQETKLQKGDAKHPENFEVKVTQKDSETKITTKHNDDTVHTGANTHASEKAIVKDAKLPLPGTGSKSNGTVLNTNIGNIQQDRLTSVEHTKLNGIDNDAVDIHQNRDGNMPDMKGKDKTSKTDDNEAKKHEYLKDGVNEKNERADKSKTADGDGEIKSSLKGHISDKLETVGISQTDDNMGDPHKTIAGPDKVQNSDNIKAPVKEEKIVKDENDNKPDSVVPGGKIDDRFTSKVFNSVPDALRLERRLHPNVNAPIRDIRQSLRNILHLIQNSVYRAEHDYAYAFNSTRWILMVGVREKLTNLVEENDKVYGVVLETSLLTKDIYRRAHERRVYGNILAPAAARSRDPVMTSLHLRPLHIKSRNEIGRAEDLRRSMSRAIRDKGHIQSKYEDVRKKVIELFSSQAMYDLSRRAKKTIYQLELAQHHQNARNGMSLYGHMHRNTYMNMATARNLTRVSREGLRHVKHDSMKNMKSAEDLMMRLRDRVPSVAARMSFDETSMLQWHQAETVRDHADRLFKESTFIHVKLVPVLNNAKEILKNYDEDSLSTRMRNALADIRNTKQLLRAVMDKIYVHLQAEHLLRERCDQFEGSGYDDEGFIFIDCDEYEKVTDGGSGDGLTDEEGSGDIDGVTVDLELPSLSNTTLDSTDDKKENETVDIEITDMTDIPTLETDEIDSIFIDGDADGLIDSTDIDEASTVDIELEKRTKVPTNDKPETTTTTKPDTTASTMTKPDTTASTMTKPDTTATTTTKPDTTASTTTKPDTTASTTTKPDTTASTTTKTDTKASTTTKPDTTIKTTSTLKTTTSLTTTTTEKEGGFWNIFGLANDEPVIEDIIDLETEDISNLTFNELVRLKLSNYSRTSKERYEEAKILNDKATEIGLTWDKVKARFESSMNRTIQTRAFVDMWGAESATFSAVHSRVKHVNEETSLKVDLVDSLTTEAVSKAEKKLKTYEKVYNEQANDGSQDVDPVHVQQLKDSVQKAKDDLKSIASLTTLAPSPCKVAAAYVNRMRANISELRHKIEQAKLLASSLQGAVQLDGSSFLTVPVNGNQVGQTGFTNKLDLVLNVTEAEGTVVGVETEETGSFILKMEDRIPSVIVVDKDKWKIKEVSSEIELEEHSWYKLVLERFSKTFNLTVYDPDTNDVVATKSLPIDDDDYLSQQSPVIKAFVGGLSDEFSDYGYWSGCIGSVVLDGQILNLMGETSDGYKLDMCTAETNNSTMYHRQSNLVLNDAGFVNYRIGPNIQRQRIQFVAIKFRFKSEGLLLSLTRGNLGIGVVAFIEDHNLYVVIRMLRGKEMTAVFKTVHFDKDHNLEVKFRGRPVVTLNGQKASLKSSPKSTYFVDSDIEEVYIGASPSYNRSLIGCIHSLNINENQISLPEVWQWQGAYIGTCDSSGCVEFGTANMSLTEIDLPEVKVVHVVFHYGSVGPLLQYSKSEKFDISVYVDNTSIILDEAIGDDSIDTLTIEQYSPGDIITLKLEDTDDEVIVSVGKSSLEVEYKADGFWYGGQDRTYSVTFGSYTNATDLFKGQVEEVIVNGRHWDLLAHKTNDLDVCRLVSPGMTRWMQDVDDEPLTC